MAQSQPFKINVGSKPSNSSKGFQVFVIQISNPCFNPSTMNLEIFLQNTKNKNLKINKIANS